MSLLLLVLLLALKAATTYPIPASSTLPPSALRDPHKPHRAVAEMERKKGEMTRSLALALALALTLTLAVTYTEPCRAVPWRPSPRRWQGMLGTKAGSGERVGLDFSPARRHGCASYDAGVLCCAVLCCALGCGLQTLALPHERGRGSSDMSDNAFQDV